MSWILTLLFVAGAVLLGRIYYGIRQMKERTVKDWDAKLIERLRAAGTDPFQPHNVDFFMAGHWELQTTFSGSAMDYVAPAYDVQ